MSDEETKSHSPLSDLTNVKFVLIDQPPIGSVEGGMTELEARAWLAQGVPAGRTINPEVLSA